MADEDFFRNQYEDLIRDIGGVYSGQRKKPLNEEMEEGLDAQAALARQGTAGASPEVLQNILTSGGLSPEVTGLGQGLVGGQFVNPAMGEAQRIAMGGDVGTNPYLEATYERASRPLLEQLTETVNPNIDIGAAQAGRTGGGLHALLRNQAGEQTGQALTDLATGIYGGAYESDQARRMQALGQLGALGQQDVANRVTGAGVLDQGTARQLQGIGLGPTVQGMQYMDPAQLYAAGLTRQQAPWQSSIQFANLLGGAPGMSPESPNNTFANILSGALGGGSIGAASGSGWGALAGAGLGAGLAALSDERAKEDITPVGISFSGVPLYKYRYRGTDGPVQIGAMAQEVLETHPEAVVVMPSGLLGVDYGQVT